MKRIIGILLLCLLLAVFGFAQIPSGNEEPVEKKTETPEYQFTPPEWIQGSWTDIFFMTTWEFSESDVLLDDLSFKETYGSDALLKTLISETEYSFSIEIDSIVYVYVFEKDSDEMITYTRYSDGETDGPEDYYKFDLW